MCGDQGLVAVENTSRVSEQWWTVGGAAQLPGESHAWVQDSWNLSRDYWRSLQELLKICAGTLENLCKDSWKSLQGLLKISKDMFFSLSACLPFWVSFSLFLGLADQIWHIAWSRLETVGNVRSNRQRKRGSWAVTCWKTTLSCAHLPHLLRCEQGTATGRAVREQAVANCSMSGLCHTMPQTTTRNSVSWSCQHLTVLRHHGHGNMFILFLCSVQAPWSQ